MPPQRPVGDQVIDAAPGGVRVILPDRHGPPEGCADPTGPGPVGSVSRSERVRALLDAEDYARLEAAAERIDEIRSEFEHARRFASDVSARLAKIDHDVSVLRSKYGLLMSGDGDGVRAAVSDLNRFGTFGWSSMRG